MTKKFFISDTHFTHKNIIKHCDRPFKSVEEMDEEMIGLWNGVVRDRDIVVHVGDAFWSKKTALKILERLKGSFYLVRGNHDWKAEFMESLGINCITRLKDEVAYDYYGDYRITMAHRPRDLPTWVPPFSLTGNDRFDGDGNYKKEYNPYRDANREIVLCGHEHNNAPRFIKWIRDKGDQARAIMALNMSCEHWGYKPTSIEEVVAAYLDEIKKYR